MYPKITPIVFLFLTTTAGRQYYTNFNTPQSHYGFVQNSPTHSFMEALNSMVQNDRLQCVPRLLCELTSGRNLDSYRQFGLPFNVNLDSLLSLLVTINVAKSPILQFGKAAILGYTSKGNVDSCMYAYPACPKDPDGLVEYLNNYNGGFFRFFNGQPPQKNKYYRRDVQERIQTQPSKFSYDGIPVKFPNDDGYYQKNFIFPQGYHRGKFREVPFLPDRTGTGELKLDLSEFYRPAKHQKNSFAFPIL